MTGLFFGTVVVESLTDPKILDEFDVINEGVSEGLNWHLCKVRGTRAHIERLSIFLKRGRWYMHFWKGDDVIAVFKDKVFEFKHSNKKTWKSAVEYGVSIGIPREQLDFPID